MLLKKKNYVNIRFHIQGVNMSLPVSLECHEHDACNQHPVLADESQPSVLDPESVSIQRSVSQSLNVMKLNYIQKICSIFST